MDTVCGSERLSLQLEQEARDGTEYDALMICSFINDECSTSSVLGPGPAQQLQGVSIGSGWVGSGCPATPH